MKFNLTCKKCGDQFTSYRADSKYCRWRCYKASRPAPVARTCLSCSSEFYDCAAYTSRRFCSRVCSDAYRRREKILHGPYIWVRCYGHPRATKAGFIAEHVLVAEKMIGRYLNPLEEVHHINHNKTDNRPENLHVCANHAEHARIHRRDRLIAKGCDPDKEAWCRYCGVRPLSEFHVRKYPDNACKTCRNRESRKYVARNRAAYNARQRERKARRKAAKETAA